ncbi:MAG: sulfite exporter TauE/SafE family protein [Spirochaetaceae bacterium]|jgi:sulfite exporter TauE/SafE/copper chaperone CopZ|nr:sulfite exporter TauE/SafE family protein [Spirochaetaceae bacterium]
MKDMKTAKTAIFPIEGMTCPACEARIRKALSNEAGVTAADASYSRADATAAFDPAVTSEAALIAAIERLGYHVRTENRTGHESGRAAPAGYSVYRAVTLLAVIVALYLLVRQFGLFNLGSLPLAEAGTGYAALLVLGLVTSIHCLAMCGGINLSQCVTQEGKSRQLWLPTPRSSPLAESSATPSAGTPRNAPSVHSEANPRFPFSGLTTVWKPAVLYNGGRVVSYTLTGGIVGALGSVVSFSGTMRGVVQLIAGVFMLVMGVNMLGIFPKLRKFTPRLPRVLATKIEALREKGTGPLAVGLLNGLMPCGPLQAMQLYALSTGNPVKGALAMLVFGLGTFPLTAFFGAASSFLTGRFTKRLMTAAACIVAVMGLSMFSYGWNLSGFDLGRLGGLGSLIGNTSGATPQNAASSTPAPSGTVPPVTVPIPVIDGYQIINSALLPNRYPAITVQAGIPVKWTINAPEGSINGCNNRMFIREYGIEHRFTVGDNTIEFAPDRTGRFSYSCWMGMIRSSITVVEQGTDPATTASPATKEQNFTLTPAGVTIPADPIAIAEKNEAQGFQTVTINLRDDGIAPAVVVLERYVPAAWIINNDSLDPGNAALVFPAYYQQVPMRQGENVINIMPQADFDFSTADNVFYGYVKVVDDLYTLDLDALRTEIAEWETQIYPEEYFKQGP